MSLTTARMLRAATLAIPLAIAAFLIFGEPSLRAYNDLVTWIYSEQRTYHNAMTGSLQTLSTSASWTATWAVILGSFLYGVFHAAGPGHGKVILSAYLLTQPENVKKSVALAAASSLVQGIVAIVLVYGLFYIFGLVSRDMRLAVTWSERLAFVLVIGIGLLLIWRAVKGFGWVGAKAKTHGHAYDHGQKHDHHHHHDHVCSSCGHAHTPSAEQVNSASDLKSALGVIFSIGLRPCTGAVLVLVFARFTGIPWAGVAAVFAMSFGTALTVSAIAILSVQARKLAYRLAGDGTTWMDNMVWLLAMAGGTVLVLFGWGLMLATFDAPSRSMGL
ncbi:MAG: nickel/cobalt transporter [Ahrensia sp.]|nr:nickel/cobalt transporter [Ahrensia sp.]